MLLRIWPFRQSYFGKLSRWAIENSVRIIPSSAFDPETFEHIVMITARGAFLKDSILGDVPLTAHGKNTEEASKAMIDKINSDEFVINIVGKKKKREVVQKG